MFFGHSDGSGICHQEVVYHCWIRINLLKRQQQQQKSPVCGFNVRNDQDSSFVQQSQTSEMKTSMQPYL